MAQLIAVTGSTGGLGSRVARRLAKRGVRQRLVVRDAARAPQLPHAEVVAARGYSDGEGMQAALVGVDRLLLVPAGESPDRVEEHATAIRAAAAAGVRHITYFSIARADEATSFPLALAHARTEQVVRASGLDFTFLRMNMYMDFLPYLVGADGVIRGPAAEGRLAAVSRDDLADVATAVLTSDGHANAVYDVSGPEALSLHEAAAVLSETCGRSISYHPETHEEARVSRAGTGQPWQIEAWIGSYVAMAEGMFAGTSDVVRQLAGHDPETLTTFLSRSPDLLSRITSRGVGE